MPVAPVVSRAAGDSSAVVFSMGLVDSSRARWERLEVHLFRVRLAGFVGCGGGLLMG